MTRFQCFSKLILKITANLVLIEHLLLSQVEILWVHTMLATMGQFGTEEYKHASASESNTTLTKINKWKWSAR